MRPILDALQKEEAKATRMWCIRSAKEHGTERDQLDALEKAVRDIYERTVETGKADEKRLSQIMKEYKTGHTFTVVKKLYNQKVTDGAVKPDGTFGRRLQYILSFMTDSRKHWKAIIYGEEPIPEPKDAKDRPGYEEAAAAAAQHGGGGGAAATAAKPTAAATAAAAKKKKPAPPPSPVTLGHPGPRKYAQPAVPRAAAEGKEQEPPPNGVKRPAPAAEVIDLTKKRRKKEAQERCIAARGHGHCDWDGESALSDHPYPVFGKMCAGCRAFYWKCEWSRSGPENSFDHCRCCADGGDFLVCCDTCPQIMCRRCIESVGGKAYAATVDALDQWKCFICDPANVKSRGGKAS